MWPFSNKTNNVKIVEKSVTNCETSSENQETVTLPKMLFRISNTVGMCGNYSTVQLGVLDENTVNGCSGKYLYRDISRKFGKQEYAENWMNDVLNANTELGQKTAKFLYVLKMESEREHIPWLYEYVLSMIDYYSSAYVKDRSIIEVKIAIQIDDMGDEIFNCLYSTEKKLFGKNVQQEPYMEWVEKDETFGKYEKQQGFEPLFIEDAQTQNQRQFSHIGSNTKNLLSVHWKVNLNNIII